MATSTRGRPSTAAPGDGSRTLTITNDPTRETDSEDGDDREVNPDANGVVGSLRLRAVTRRPRQRVAWNEDVVDNEGQGKKKSKICCIYHKPRRFDESSDESESDSDSDHDHAHHNHNHSHNHGHGHGHPHPYDPNAGPSSHGLLPPNPSGSVVHELEPKEAEPNAYEKQPGSSKGKRQA